MGFPEFFGTRSEIRGAEPFGRKGGGVALGLDGVWVACWVEVFGLAGHFLYLRGGISDPQRWVEFLGNSRNFSCFY